MYTVGACVCVWAYLYVSAVVTSGWQLDSSERDRTFEGNFNCRLLDAVLSVQTGGPRDGAAAEISLYWNKKIKKEAELLYCWHNPIYHVVFRGFFVRR